MPIQHAFDRPLPLQSGYVYRILGILGAQRAMSWQTEHLTTPRHNAGEPPVETVSDWEFHRSPASRWRARCWRCAPSSAASAGSSSGAGRTSCPRIRRC